MNNEFGTKKSFVTIKKLAVLFVVVIVIIIAGAVYWAKFRQVEIERGIVIDPPTVIAIDITKMPTGIPTDLPIEEDVQILQNFETQEEGTNKFQSTRQYISKKSFGENVSVYSDYFFKNEEWSINSPIIGDDLVTFVAEGVNGEEMLISIGKTDLESQTVISINLIYTKE
ncbi:MAG: hypothetical protein COV33_01735 [Candidatus Zambryskibacteria bacterium CG10_big_fil_rev_8_21_14_0_10_34_34]|uniref:Uncharacterized protein n=1 Tax=Candidatus Zambryskibacteria bacterium CG10_big_fil_rev_8_21_14_0_10_34_34 TaxID=1975114 RepID=A0A2H0R1A3_9BACT|nr:MAG: hypothetical protein COV33_01735 [Candidatus Zambryskibacteria bacterium CG10_big_fil_rev_8_21_14_0_10_34_34]